MFNKNKKENSNLENNAIKAETLGGETEEKRKGSFSEWFNFSAFTKSFLCVILAVALFFGGFFVGRRSDDKEIAELDFLLSTYKDHYLYAKDGNIVSVVSDALLDKYSNFYTAEEYESKTKQDAGERVGMGIAFSVADDVATIYYVAGNSPAYHAGITDGGVLVAGKMHEDEQFIEFEKYSEFSEFVSKLKTNQFDLKIRYGEEIKLFTLACANYNETYVFYADCDGRYGFSDVSGTMVFEKTNEAAPDISEDIGYIKLTSFHGGNDLYGATGQFREALKMFTERGRKKLIVDLRNNGGGYVSIMGEITALLCGAENGQKVISMTAIDKYDSETNYYTSVVESEQYSVEQIIFLANQNSASASEALMGAVLDYDNKNSVRVIVSPYVEANGETVYRTYGKGIMQTPYTDKQTGCSVLLTTAQIYWPVSKTCIHGIGLTTALNLNGKTLVINGEGEDTFSQAVKLFG